VAAGVLVVAREVQLLHRTLLVAISDPDPTAAEALALRYLATATSHGQQQVLV
jgi:DNA-binding FadR family transcriptional regulator